VDKLCRICLLLTAGTVFLVILLYYLQTGLLESIEAKTFDLRLQTLRDGRPPSDKLAIVAIDEKSIEALGRFPWSRSHFSRFLDAAATAGAQAVLFDVLFLEGQSPEVDRELADAIRRSDMTTLAAAVEFAPDGGVSAVRRTFPILGRAARRSAHINILPDEDGVTRWTPLLLPTGDGYLPSLGLATAMDALGVRLFEVGEYEVRVGDRIIPTDGQHRMLIDYTGPPGAYPRYSLVDVLEGRVWQEELRGRVLLVGATALGLLDMRVTPFSNNSPGVELNANVADTILRGDYLRRGGMEALLDLLLIVGLGFAVSVVSFRFRVAVAFPVTVLIAVACVLLVGEAFVAGRWLSLVYPLLAVTLVYALISYLRFMLQDRRAAAVRAMFSSYVSKKVVDQLVKNPELARVGGDSKVVTILFADIRNYTSYSEKRTPRQVVRILNEYLAAMTEVVLEHDGTVDKFMGDGILAYWGAPLEQENHAELAARCALKMLERLKSLQKRWGQSGQEPLECGIGLNSGEVIAGNIGAQGKKVEYTVIGDTVNLAFRIQSDGRERNRPVITASTFENIRHMAHCEPMPAVRVKGKQDPVPLYALLGLQSEALPARGAAVRTA